METLIQIIEMHGLWVVFVCVLLNQGGIPVPAFAPMIVTAALAVDADKPLWLLLLVAVLAALISDWVWFAGGRRFGTTLLRLMCKLSLSPDSCVGLTRRIYGRWGPPSLLVAKYVPGFAAVATTLAGEAGISARRFALYDGLGAALWAGGAIAIGVIFHEAVETALTELERLGRYALVVISLAIALFLAGKWWQRRRFLLKIRMARISVTELAALQSSGTRIRILDVRDPARRARSGWIPGSLGVEQLAALPSDEREDVVVYCDCPNDASAAVAAQSLKHRGFTRVRPLAGGIQAWRAQGFPLEGGELEDKVAPAAAR